MAPANTEREVNTLRPRTNAAQWCIVALLGCIAATLIIAVTQSATPTLAQPVQTGGDHQGVFAVAGQVSHESYGLYLVDTQRNSLLIYEFNPANRHLRLMAARNYRFDRQLESYNNDPLQQPSDVADMVRQAQQIPTTAAASQPN